MTLHEIDCRCGACMSRVHREFYDMIGATMVAIEQQKGKAMPQPINEILRDLFRDADRLRYEDGLAAMSDVEALNKRFGDLLQNHIALLGVVDRMVLHMRSTGAVI